MVSQKSQKASKQKILIVGGGFGGIKAALELATDPRFEVTLLSDQENFRFYPTLYLAALGGSRFASSIPLAEIFENKDIKITKTTVKSIKRDKKRVTDSKNNSYDYDTLILSLGVVTNFFGIKGLKKYAYGIKTLEEAQKLRDHLHKQLIDQKKPDVNYLIIGGGPTGVELAGALPSYIHLIMRKHGLSVRKINVGLVEAATRLLPRMPKAYSKAIQKQLRSLGVKLYLGQTVQAETADSLMVDNHPLQSSTVIWTAGVTNHPFFKLNNFHLSERGKVKVNPLLEAEPSIYVIGDNAETVYSGMAQTALYDGKFVAENLKKKAEGQSMKTYIPKSPVYVNPAGPGWAAVLWGGLHIHGWLGWGMRQGADFMAYHDYEPWWKASKHFLALNDKEESCPLCASR